MIIKAIEYIESGEVSFEDGRALCDKEMVALELCPHGDLSSFLSGTVPNKLLAKHFSR